jgi:hypothetical protein
MNEEQINELLAENARLSHELAEARAALREASLSSTPAQEDGSKELGAHPRGSGQNTQSEGV